ncbi:MAG: Y-family DNA polymerase [Phycisphaerae bacterium]|jgi:DNA polymerase V|nr:Y-family DNA polymerase [Phycisphaerae bacterium]
MYALADCNNFYASCERVFEPHLARKPVVVLSNNDGCIIARSQEAKDIGFKMGDPIFKCRDLVKQHNVIVRSSNFSLYGDMSRRVMQTIRLFSPDVEIYSIDEAFIKLDGLIDRNFEDEMRRMRAAVLQWTGIPISIGIGKTKTLAKLANHYAKKTPEIGGVAQIPKNANEMLRAVEVGAIWGIGRQWSKKFRNIGVHTAFDLVQMEPAVIKKTFNIVAMKTVMELRGCTYYRLEQTPEQRKTLLRSRSFASPVTTWQEVSEAIASHATRAAEKLRNEELVASVLKVFFHTSLFNHRKPRHSAHATIELIPPTSTTHTIIKAALAAAYPIWKEGFEYKRAGVYLLELSKGQPQASLFESPEEKIRDKNIMSVLDAVNTNMGAGTLHFAATGFTKVMQMRQLQRSPRYTTHWDELPQVMS